jgi:hypothetical protein
MEKYMFSRDLASNGPPTGIRSKCLVWTPPCVREVAAWVGSTFPGALEGTPGSLRAEIQRRVVARLLPPESSSLEAVSQKTGISVVTLERWWAAALAAHDGNAGPRPWSPAARLEAVIATAAMDEAIRSAWCREHGLFPTDLDRWKQDQGAGMRPGPQGQGPGRNGRLAGPVKKVVGLFRGGEDA